MPKKPELDIFLQPKQKEAFYKSFETPVMFYGGAKGGGKSFLVRARELYRRLTFPNTNGLILRKTYPELISNHIRKFWVEYPFTRKWYNKSEKTIYYPNGSTTEFSYLQHTDDVYNFQGREYEDITIDEITQHEEDVFKILRSSNRTTNVNIKPTIFLTGNPGGPGMAWVKRIFVDRNFNDGEIPDDFDFVQAKVWDNKLLLQNDPQYITRLKGLPEDQRRAYLDGDWDIFSGQVFSEFRRQYHVIDPIIPSKSFTHFLWIDWGYSEKSACAIYLAALIPQTTQDGREFNRVIVYKEWYGNQKHPNEWAEIVYRGCKQIGIKPKRCYTDPAIHSSQQSGEQSIAKLFEWKWKELNDGLWVRAEKGANSGSASRVNRVGMLHNWLSFAYDGMPYILFTKNCENLIRTLPLLVYDENQPETYDTSMEDHGTDAITYGLSKIKFVDASSGVREFVLDGSVKRARLFDENGDGLAIDMKAFRKMI